MRARPLSKMALARWSGLRCSARTVLLVRSLAGKTKPSHGDVVGISESGRYSAIAHMMGNPEVDPGGPEEVAVGLPRARFWATPECSLAPVFLGIQRPEVQTISDCTPSSVPQRFITSDIIAAVSSQAHSGC